MIWSRSTLLSVRRTASAPIIASKFSPYFSRASWYSVSESSCMYFSGVSPGSMTM